MPLTEFRLEVGLPVWRYDVGRHRRRETAADAARPKHRARALRAQERGLRCAPRHLDRGSPPFPRRFRRRAARSSVDRYSEPRTGTSLDFAALPPLKFMVDGARAEYAERQATWSERRYSVEESRGYMDTAGAWTPGVFTLDLTATRSATFIASTEPWEVVTAMQGAAALAAERERRHECIEAADPGARHGLAAELVLAADQFIVTPVGRTAEAARVRARGDEERSVIAGYHWFTDWGRDTMISLEGLTLLTGRTAEAKGILRTFTSCIRDGLVPNLFPEGDSHGLYHTADATLWLFHALDRYVAATSDRALLHALLPQLVDVVQQHLVGTRFGIGVDPHDGLLRQGAPGFQLTWMDAKVGDWVVTPRRGKAVEINALWYNALCLLADWVRNTDRAAEGAWLEAAAARVRTSFNRRFLARARRAPIRRRRRRERRRRGLPPESDHGDLAGLPRSRAALLATCPRGRPQRAADTVRPAHVEPETPRLSTEVLRRPTEPRRRLPPRHRVAVAARPIHRCVAASVPGGSGGHRRSSSPLSTAIWTTAASAPSAKSSMRSRRTQPAVASRKRGALPKCCAARCTPRAIATGLQSSASSSPSSPRSVT